MHPTMLSRRFAPAASVQSVVLPHAFGLRSIVAVWTWCATSMASTAAARTATTTMHSTTALHTAGVAATCATSARASRKLSVHAVVLCA